MYLGQLQHHEKEAAVKYGALAIVMILGAFGSALYDPAFAQNALGGPKKQTFVGGPAKQTAVGGPARQNAIGGLPKQNAVAGPAKQVSPVAPPNKTGSSAASPPSPLKCTAGACAAKGTKR